MANVMHCLPRVFYLHPFPGLLFRCCMNNQQSENPIVKFELAVKEYLAVIMFDGLTITEACGILEDTILSLKESFENFETEDIKSFIKQMEADPGTFKFGIHSARLTLEAFKIPKSFEYPEIIGVLRFVQINVAFQTFNKVLDMHRTPTPSKCCGRCVQGVDKCIKED